MCQLTHSCCCCCSLQSLISRWPLIFAPGTNNLVLPNPLENYTRIGGAIPFSSDDMPYQPEVWGAISPRRLPALASERARSPAVGRYACYD